MYAYKSKGLAITTKPAFSKNTRNYYFKPCKYKRKEKTITTKNHLNHIDAQHCSLVLTEVM